MGTFQAKKRRSSLNPTPASLQRDGSIFQLQITNYKLRIIFTPQQMQNPRSVSAIPNINQNIPHLPRRRRTCSIQTKFIAVGFNQRHGSQSNSCLASAEGFIFSITNYKLRIIFTPQQMQNPRSVSAIPNINQNIPHLPRRRRTCSIQTKFIAVGFNQRHGSNPEPANNSGKY